MRPCGFSPTTWSRGSNSPTSLPRAGGHSQPFKSSIRLRVNRSRNSARTAQRNWALLALNRKAEAHKGIDQILTARPSQKRCCRMRR